MEFRQLGDSGLKVSAIGLGTNNFGARVDAEGTAKVIDQALHEGINLLDTANIYSKGLSEEYIGRALKGRRHEAVIATKVGGRMGDGPNDAGASKKHIRHEIEESLRRLGTDYVDLYQIHFVDESTPIDETIRVLDDLVNEGKVRYTGCSNFAAWQVCEGVWTSESLGLTSFSSVQPHYSMLVREPERELVPFCDEYGIGILPYFPLASGFLTGKYRRGQPAPAGTRLAENDRGMFVDANYDLIEALESFAEQRGHSLLELAFAWLLARPAVSSVIAGATKPEQVTANAKAVSWHLTDEDLTQVEAILEG